MNGFSYATRAPSTSRTTSAAGQSSPSLRCLAAPHRTSLRATTTRTMMMPAPSSNESVPNSPALLSPTSSRGTSVHYPGRMRRVRLSPRLHRCASTGMRGRNGKDFISRGPRFAPFGKLSRKALSEPTHSRREVDIRHFCGESVQDATSLLVGRGRAARISQHRSTHFE